MTRSKASALLVLLCVVLALPVRAQPQVITMQNAATATGNGTAIVVSTSSSTSGSNHGAIGVQIIEVVSGTWEITFEKTSDGTNWTAVMATNEADDTRATTATAAGHYTVVIGSAVQFRARISSYSSGTITVKGRLTQGGVAFRTTSGGGGGGSGDVVGPASATDNAVARFNLTTGKLIQNSVVTIGDTGNMAGVANLTFTGVLTGGSAPTTITDSAGKILSAALNTVQPAQGGTGITALGTGVATALGVNTGSAGAFVVLGGALGTPSSGTATNLTGLPISTGVSGLGTGIATALGVNVGSAGAPVLFDGAGGTPSSINLTNGTALPLSTGVSGDLPFANFVQAGSAGFVGATGAGDYSHRTPTQVTAALDNFVGDSGSGGTKGLVPAPSAGDAAANKYLKADGTWATVSGGSGITVGTTTVTSGTATRLFYETAGNVVGQVSGATSDGTNVTFGSGNLRATLPQITTGLADANGNTMLAFSPTGSATQYLTIANNTATNAVSLTANAPTVAASAQAGTPFNLTASAATAGDTNVGAAAGGSVTITAGNAARLTSGNANGGDIVLSTGTGIGTGTQGQVYLPFNGTAAKPAIKIGTSNEYGIYRGGNAGNAIVITVNGTARVALADANVNAAMVVDQPIGWGTPSTATLDLILRRSAAAHMTWGATDAASPVAQTLSVQGGTGTNVAGATWTLRGSLGTSQGAPGRIHLTGGAMIAASGTTQQTAVDRIISGATKVLMNNSAVTLVNVTNASDTNAGGVIDYCVEVTDSTDQQYECGMVTYGVSNKGGVWSGNTATKFGNHQNATSGTLTVTFAISGANPALLSVNANSSLSPSSGFPRITYSLRNLTQQAVAVQ